MEGGPMMETVETVGLLAYNVPFFSIFLALLAAIVTPLLPRGSRAAERLTLVVAALIGVLSAYLLAALAETGRSFTFMMGHFPAPWGNELRAGPLEALLALFFSIVLFLPAGSVSCRSGRCARSARRRRRGPQCARGRPRRRRTPS